MAFNGLTCTYINFDRPLVQKNLWISYLTSPSAPVVYAMTLPWGFVGPLMSAILLFLDWGVPIIFPWNKPPKFKQTYCFWLPGHCSWDLLRPSEGTYFEDKVSHKLRCFPVNLIMKLSNLWYPHFHPLRNTESLIPQFSTQKDLNKLTQRSQNIKQAELDPREAYQRFQREAANPKGSVGTSTCS